MPFRSIIDPRQLAILTAALEDFCRIADIRAGTLEYDEAGRLVMSLFSAGATTPEALKTALENRLLREIERPSVSDGLSENAC